MSIELKNVSYVYNPDSKKPVFAVNHVDVTIKRGEFCAIIGHTGSGKSTLIQFFNGLLKPTFGEVYFDGHNIFEKGYPLKMLRQKVGLVFQYPEHQLFETDVFKDICFGPKNMGLKQEEIEARAEKAMKLAGLDESYKEKSPFELSGGEKRRVAIAGILAMEPEFLVLDEPTAGLDPEGRDEILEHVKRLSKETGMTVVLVSHSMEDVARYADRLIVMNQAQKVFDGPTREVFKHYLELETMGLSAPRITYIAHSLIERGFDIPEDVLTVEECRDAILKVLRAHDS